ncbi:MAG TPA: hypothetical protein VHA52_11400, partial [Candidatus Babeliaceae bacterium]|nr:hypothetical protein [Candidatus Babeliaceae bacterium]
QQIPAITKEVKDSLLPLVQESIQKVSIAIDRDLNRVASTLETTARPIQEVIQKVNNGTGFVGELVNDTQTSRDITVTVQSVKECFSRFDNIALSFDTHLEALRRLPHQQDCNDFKGYCNAIIFPDRNYFCLVGATATRRGLLYRNRSYREQALHFDHRQSSLALDLPHKKSCTCAVCDRTTRQLDKVLLNLQLGGIYNNNLAFRFGVFEGFAGVGIDYDIPLPSERLRWITSFEAFDFTGCNRLCDTRPHLRWINRLFVTDNIYGVIGFDDFISRRNKSAFFGVGFCFSNDDITYLFRPHVTV